jgi:sec-independent protein translocase protein TatA
MMSTGLTDLIMGIVAGTEWIIIVIVIAVLIFGAKKVPELAKSLGRATSEYEKAKYEAKNELQRIRNPGTTDIQENRDKLETVADTLGIKYLDKNDEELRAAIQREIEKDKRV